MAIELWDTVALMDVQYADEAAPPDGFWLSRYFPGRFYSQAQEIAFDDVIPRDRRLAPFVAPNMQGRVMRSRGASMKSVSPGYLKPKHVINPEKALVRMRGERPLGGLNTGSLSLGQRFDAHVAASVVAEREMIERRWDWMACRAAAYGKTIIKGEDYPEVTVDFGRNAALELTPGGGLTWDNSNAVPLVNISAQRKLAFSLGNAPITDLIFGPDAWAAFAKHATVLPLLDNMRRGSGSNFNTTGLFDGQPVENMGQISGPDGGGRLDLWVYSNTYEDPDDGQVYNYLAPGDVVGLGRNLGGVMAFGAILDADAGLASVPLFPKNWKNQDPSQVLTMTQSAPLAIPTNINNSFLIHAL